MSTSFRKDRMSIARNYALYYGFGRVNELSHFDIAIVDSKSLSIQEVQELKVKNTLIITYLSIFEVSPTEPIFKELADEDFWLVEGEPIKNEAYGTFLVNIQSKKWINHLLKEVNRQFMVLESDGLFMDTIGDIELHGLPEDIRKQQLEGLIKFLYALKMLYPTHVYIQNNGIEQVCLYTAPYIDGICWENPPIGLAESEEWVNVMENRLLGLGEKYDLQVFLLLEETIEAERKSYEKIKKFAKKHDYLLYNAPYKYVGGVNLLK